MAKKESHQRHESRLTLATRLMAVSDIKRIILDISSIARWTGPAVGILRVEHALARYALAHRPDIVLSFYDKASATFRVVNPRWVRHLVSWDGAVGRRRGALFSLLPSPYSVVDALERWRVACRNEAVARRIEQVQRFVLLARRRRRRAVVPFAIAIGRPLVLGPDDVILSVGSDWTNKDVDAIAALKRRFRFRYVVICYDIIALLFPQHFSASAVAAFRHYWTQMFAVADLVLVNSRRVESDVASYCAENGINLAPCHLARLGYDYPPAIAPAPLPDGLQAGRFILFVSTIEPRKGHAMLMRVWQRLLAANVPQRQRFKMVFVGRRGWGVDAVIDQMSNSGPFAGTLMHLVGISDQQLVSLYRAAAFCVYPSRYEGFGLPVIEAFSHGRAVITSTGGALPETADGFAPCLDPDDDDAWFGTLKTWIEHPGARQLYEAKIRADFSWPTWEDAAARILETTKAK